MSDEKSLAERVARIESDIEHIERLDEIRATTAKEISKKLDKIDDELSRYRGFVGGILLMVTAVVTFFKIFGEDIAGWLGK